MAYRFVMAGLYDGMSQPKPNATPRLMLSLSKHEAAATSPSRRREARFGGRRMVDRLSVRLLVWRLI